MRSSFGTLAQQIRARLGMTQTQFAEMIGESLSRVSSLEHGRVHINEKVTNKYIDNLGCSGEEAMKFREYSEHSNRRLLAKNKGVPHDNIHAILERHGHNLSSKGIDAIKGILAEELGAEVASLKFSNTRGKSAQQAESKKHRGYRRAPVPGLHRFVDICLLAESYRSQYATEMERLDIEKFLVGESVRDASLDLDILETLPGYADGAYACIVGRSGGRTILVEESWYYSACKGVQFKRHVLCHEFAHHVLHGGLLNSENESYLPPQELAKISGSEDEFSGQIEQVIDNSQESEAELLAVMLLVPWQRFLIGLEPYHLAKDYGEQQRAIEYFAKYFSNPALLGRFKAVLWERGEREHPIFQIAD